MPKSTRPKPISNKPSSGKPSSTKSIRSPRQQRLIDLLVEARREAGLTQVVLAERVGRPQSFVAKYEGGERRLDVVEFVELVEAMGSDPQGVFARLLQPREPG